MKKPKSLKRALLFITLFNFAFFVEAQMLWQDTRYGMTVDEVKALYPHALDIYEPFSYDEVLIDLALLIFEKVEIANHLFDVKFKFTPDESTLCAVILSCNEESVRKDGHSIYYRLYDEFTEKYGNSVKDERKASVRQKEYPHFWDTGIWRTTWNSNNTSISLDYWYSHEQASKLFSLNIFYNRQ